MKKLIVTGASGFLGWNICQSVRQEWNVYGTVYSNSLEINGAEVIKLDLTNYKELKKAFHEISPDAVIHTAAASDPGYCQLHQNETRGINVDAAVNIAMLCSDINIPFVFTSTDLVFDGLNAPYREDDPVGPVNIYAEQKVMAEEKILKVYPESAVCRMSLMFGIPSPFNQSFIKPMIRAMRDGGELTLFVDEFRTPVSVNSATQGILVALEKLQGLIHLGGRERISRYDFGLLMEKLRSNHKAKLIPCNQKDIEMPAPRALDVSLDSSKALALGYNPLPLKEELERLLDREMH